MLRRAVFVGVVTSVLGLGVLAPAVAKPETSPDPSAQAVVAQLEGGGFGNGSKWGVVDNAESCIDSNTFDEDGLGIRDASLNASTFDDNDEPGSFDDAFDEALVSYLDDVVFMDTAPVTDDATFYRSGPVTLSGLEISVEYRTFASQPAIRHLVTLSNPTGEPISTEFGWGNDTGADTPSIGPPPDTGTEIVGTGSGDLTLTPSDSYVTINDDGETGPDDADPVSTYVMFGTGAGLQPSGFDPDCGVFGDDSASEEELGVTYDVTVPAGSTVYLMFFAAIDVDDATALAHAQELVNLCVTHEKVADLSAEVKAAILNWAFPECPPTLVAAFTG